MRLSLAMNGNICLASTEEQLKYLQESEIDTCKNRRCKVKMLLYKKNSILSHICLPTDTVCLVVSSEETILSHIKSIVNFTGHSTIGEFSSSEKSFTSVVNATRDPMIHVLIEPHRIYLTPLHTPVIQNNQSKVRNNQEQCARTMYPVLRVQK